MLPATTVDQETDRSKRLAQRSQKPKWDLADHESAGIRSALSALAQSTTEHDRLLANHHDPLAAHASDTGMPSHNSPKPPKGT